MRTTRLYLNQSLAVGQTIDLDERAHRHVVQVLRLRPGAELVLFNGQGGEYRASLSEAQKRHSSVTLTGFDPATTRPRLNVTLVQGISKGDRMDYSLQKATELGVSRIQPVLTQRSQTPGDPRRLENRMEHWRGVVISACEQCGRNELPELGSVMSFQEWLGSPPDHGLGLVLDPRADTGLPGLAPPEGAVSLLIGPEGGLDETEIQAARHRGFTPVRLGPRILRTETAGVAALAVIQGIWGDLR
ncbi:16S rRNA (uracil(1498)-N(3))-methyltransferase [Thioalkalivibrio sulfidiphilus]|uniref:16S rRNA (uracil(1498)-N(3))-methyltransferase n=1 Tax=Thioalkalivibrio sulfidiphilus TaxID=1033854 RepID=UPI00047665E5|nr:16S rRNA (uracil(1498)-N(3))-methyltransferase [Thioalkalivibrio sulfidiphilus]